MYSRPDRRAVNDGEIRLAGRWPCSQCNGGPVVLRVCQGGDGCWVGRPANSDWHGDYYCHGCGREWAA